MNQSDLLFYFRLFLGRLPLIALCAIPVATIGFIVAFTLPSTYRASARILVEAPDIPSEMARSTVVTSSVEQFQIIQQEVTTQRHLLDLAERLGISGKDGLQPDDIVDELRSRIGFQQIEMDAPQGETRAVIFGISFDARDPVLTAKVVNDIVDYILNKNKRLRKDQAEITRSFFEGEVARLGTKLKEIESKILEFRNAKQSALPDSLDFRRSQLQGSQDRMAQLEREDASLRSRRTNLQQMLGGQVQGSGPLSPDQQMLQDLNRALAEQLTVYKEDSPTIATLRARIATVTRGLEAEKAGARPHGPTEFDLQMSDIDERLNFITDERSRLQKAMVTLSRSISETPSNEAMLNEMERGRDNIQVQYNLAVSKLSEAATGEQIELSAKGSRFSLVEPATPPREPISPKRLQISLLSIFAGFGVGIGLVVLLELLNTKVRRPAELANLLGTQPLVTVPYVYTKAERRAPGWQARLMQRLFSGREITRSGNLARVSIGVKS